MRRVEIRKPAAAGIVAHAMARLPHECCGLLIGDGARIEQAAPARNIATNPRTKFLINPDDHFASIRAARAAGLTVMGAYHSHPRGPATPSETDRAEAFDDPEFLQVIVSPVAKGGVQLAAYYLLKGDFDAAELVTVD
jgi:proteasome lid subunit RPN8/RPN11